MMDGRQMPLFTIDQVLSAYGQGEEGVSNKTIYEALSQKSGVPEKVFDSKQAIGRSGQKHNLAGRSVRWIQQTAKHLGLLERVPGRRGVWRLTGQGKQMVGEAVPGTALLAFSTRWGIAIWAHWEDVHPHLREQVHVCISSPPYLLAKQRAYGNPPTEREYIDFIVASIEPVVRLLAPGGSICLNLGNASFEPGKPSRRLYMERLTLRLADEFHLHKMDAIIWHNTSAPPGPVQWSSKQRVQLNASYETLLWFTNDPARCFADNRRILEPHSERHLKLLEKGGEQRHGVFSDGAYRIREGSFSNLTEGRIPRNVWPIGHRDKESIACNAYAKEHGFQAHGAPMPLALADRLVRFLSCEDHVILDWCAGRLTTARAAEMNKRRWIAVEKVGDYLSVARAVRFPEAA